MRERERRLSELTGGQRIWRRIALLGGSYTWPDGTIELDFEEPAGIDHWGDDETTQERKLHLYGIRQGRRTRKSGALFLAAAVLLLGLHIDLPTWQLLAVVCLVFVGIRNLVA